MKRILKINWGKYLEQLPKDWDIKKIGDIFRVTAGGDIDRKYVSKIKNEKYSVPIYANSLNDFGLYGYTTHPKVLNETITVTARGELGYAVPRYEPYYPIVRLLVLEPKKKCNIYFFSEILNSTRVYIEASGVPQLTAPQIRTYKIPVPPLREQDKIASILSTWDEAISLYGKLSNQVEQYKMILLKQLTDVKYLNESLKVKTREVSFSKAYSRIAIGKNKIKKSEYLSYENGKIPVIDQSQEYIAGYSNMEDKIIYADKENPLIVFGDHTRVIKQINFEFITGADGVVVLAHNSELLDSSYAYHLLSSLEIPDTGYNRHYKFLEETIFDIPNLEVQRKLGKILDEFDAYLKQLNLMISYLQEQKRGLMQLLLTGKVRV